jgi:hypothetical protein
LSILSRISVSVSRTVVQRRSQRLPDRINTISKIQGVLILPAYYRVPDSLSDYQKRPRDGGLFLRFTLKNLVSLRL